MAKRQTRRSASVKGSTAKRIERFTDDHHPSSSAFLEVLITEQIGSPSEATTNAYEVEMARRDSVKPKIRPEPDSSDTEKRPSHLQPTPEPKEPATLTQEELAEEMKGYVDPHTLF